VPAHEALIGNQSLRARLYKAADEQRMHHCFLFEGPAGIGKAAIALHLAMYVNCLVEEEGQRGLSFHRPSRPCGHCRSCQPILAGSHPDIIQVGPDPSKVTRIITTEQARGLINALSLQRHSAKRRFVIIDPVDALNEEAANALLKTLEEPPAGTQFILITSRAASLLQTVRSRSQRVRFGPVGEAEMIPWLEARNLDPRLAALSMGSPGRALALAEGGTQLAEELLASLCAAIGQPVYQLFAFTEGLGKKAEGGSERTELVLDLIEELLRDTVLVANGQSEKVLHPNQRGMLQKWAFGLYPGGVGRLLGGVANARDRLRLNVNGRVVLEALLSQLNLELSQVRA
jgi:DNA polymerase III subunit delta'